MTLDNYQTLYPKSDAIPPRERANINRLEFVKNDRPPIRYQGMSLDGEWSKYIQEKEETLWKESHPGKKLFITICRLCQARHLLDFDADKKHFECTCETGAPNGKQTRYFICNSKHPHFDVPKSFDGTHNDCKICQKVLNTSTKTEEKIKLKLRLEYEEERKAGAELLKKMEDVKAKDKAKEKKTESELFAAVLTKQLIPLFEGLRQEIRNDRKKKTAT